MERPFRRPFVPGVNDLATTRPDLAKEWHPTKNGELKPSDLLSGSGRKVWWKCLTCGTEWCASVNNRSRGNGCPKCNIAGKARRQFVPGVNDLATTRPDLAKEWHPTKNGELKPSDLLSGSGRKVWWKCLTCGTEWCAMVNSRSRGSGCPKCADTRRLAWNAQHENAVDQEKKNNDGGG